jgi:hypothetical protein
MVIDSPTNSPWADAVVSVTTPPISCLATTKRFTGFTVPSVLKLFAVSSALVLA